MHIPLPSLSTELAPITEALDSATHDQRWNWLNGLSARELRAMYELAGPAALSCRTDQLVATDSSVVIHQGKNTLPAFSVFQKRFARLPDVVAGYNHNWWQDIIRAYGHYRAYDAPDSQTEVWIDYIDIPEAQHPDFPGLRPNTGLGSLIYGNLIDVLRRVSAHVTIGAAVRNKKLTSNRFALLAPEDHGVEETP